ncbi:alpha/beta hydrolase, partial [Nocardia sp. NPDC058518]
AAPYAELYVTQHQRGGGGLGEPTAIVPIEGARHDVFLSSEAVRANAFQETDSWLDWLAAYRKS